MTRPRLLRLAADRSTALTLLTLGALLGLVYLHWTPLAPDLAAQVARANVARTAGDTAWWTGWFGGLSLPTYSVLTPPGMALLGVRVTGVLAVLGGTAATSTLVRNSIRPRAAAAAFAIAGVADLLDGRVTFTTGMALGAWALVAVRARRPLAAGLLAVAAYLASPLAGLFLGMVLVAIAVVDPSRRRGAIVGAGVLSAIAIAMAFMFPGTGTMPVSLSDTVPAGLCCLGVLIVCRNSVVRLTAAIVLLSFPVLLVIPGAIGANITRLSWVCAVPVVVACAPLPRRWLVPALVALAIWPLSDLAEQLHSATDASAKPAFYQPLQAQLRTEQQNAGPGAVGQRVEVVDTVNHWGSVYLSTVSLARGWDRQADNTYNPIFYNKSLLTVASYRQWLDQLAVGWVALPNARLDYASVAEAALLRRDLSYLTLAWSNRDWKLYRVTDPAPLADGATIGSVDVGAVTLTVAAATTVALRMRWSPYLTVRDPTTKQSVPACITDADGWVQLYLAQAETVQLTSAFNAGARLSAPDPDCAQDLIEH